VGGKATLLLCAFLFVLTYPPMSRLLSIVATSLLPFFLPAPWLHEENKIMTEENEALKPTGSRSEKKEN
jgi:hypothetical protein